MNVLEAVRKRRSIRNFLERDIPEEVVAALIDSLIWAPSAGNLQSRRFYMVKEKRLRKELAAGALNQNFIRDAPLVTVCCTDSRIGRRYGRRGVELYTIQDVSVSIMCMMLTAEEKGLGTCWVGAFDEAEISRVLDLPAHHRPVALVPVGYPSHIPAPTSRLPADEVVEFR
ncbi:MAG: nitroreductase family protein [Candidatus Sulfobium sp.]|jgi:nitroreductase